MLLRNSWRAPALLVALAALGQEKPAVPPGAEDAGVVFRADTRLVVCHTTVVDKYGHLVLDLPEAAFSVAENGVQQAIKRFKREDVPVSLGLIIDNSGSMRDKRAKVAAAALGLVKASNKDDEVFVVNFNDDAYLDLRSEEHTSELQSLRHLVCRL